MEFSRGGASRRPKHSGPGKMKAKINKMKRLKDSDIIPLIVAAPNIRQAIFAVLRGTDRKESPQGEKYSPI